MPDAASVWPMLVLIEPIKSGVAGSEDPALHSEEPAGRPNSAPRASTSIGSPSGVPVPCASTYCTSAGATPASASACRITACCAGPLGTVRPLLRPSWFVADPRMTARTGSPSAIASPSRFRTSVPHPSLRTNPSAAASNVLHLPSGASMPHFENRIAASGLRTTFTPAATARRHSPDRRLRVARCTATRPDEHAVSTAMHGPCRPSTNAIRPAAALRALPVAAYTSD